MTGSRERLLFAILYKLQLADVKLARPDGFMAFAPAHDLNRHSDSRVVWVVVLLTAGAWILASLVESWLMRGHIPASYADLVSLSGGVAFFALLLGGKWGAVGIAGGSTIALALTSGHMGFLHVAAISAATALGSYMCFLAALRLLKVDENLATIRPIHLPFIALVIALASATSTSAMLLILGHQQPSTIPEFAAATTAGNFLSCVGLVLTGWLLLRVYRLRKSQVM